MRILCDTNIFISYLISYRKDSNPIKIIEAAFYEKYTLLMPEELLVEFTENLRSKKYLATHITVENANNFIDALKTICEIIPTIYNIPKVVRDIKDDYLVAYALVGEADYLVTGDRDLLELKQINRTKIISPNQAAEII